MVNLPPWQQQGMLRLMQQQQQQQQPQQPNPMIAQLMQRGGMAPQLGQRPLQGGMANPMLSAAPPPQPIKGDSLMDSFQQFAPFMGSEGMIAQMLKQQPKKRQYGLADPYGPGLLGG